MINGPGGTLAGTGISLAGAAISSECTAGGGPAGCGEMPHTLGVILGGAGPRASPAGLRNGAEMGLAAALTDQLPT